MSTPSSIDYLEGNNEAAGVRRAAHSVFEKQVVAPLDIEVTASAAIPVEEYGDNDCNLYLTQFKDWKLDRMSLQDLFQVSRTGELSPLVFPMLHRASNNLLSRSEADVLVDFIVQSSDRRVFNALVSTTSPATKAIARSLLPGAIRSLDMKLVRSLLDTGVDPEAPFNDTLKTPLEWAIIECAWCDGIFDLIRLLFKYGARVNSPSANGRSSPLVYAASQGHLGLVQLLLAAGADVNVPASEVCQMWAITLTALEAAATGPKYVNNGNPGATEDDRLKISQVLLSAGAEVNATATGTLGETALQGAVRRGDIALVQMLLSHGANVNAPARTTCRTALQAAAVAGNLELVNLLLAWGAMDVLAAMECASWWRNLRVVQALLLFGADLDDPVKEAHKRIALKAGVRCGDRHFVRSLLKYNMDVNAFTASRDSKWTTALQEAAMRGYTDIVQLLLLSGADVNAPAAGSAGTTALQNAAFIGNAKLVRLLLDAGADPNCAPSEFGFTALQAAAYANDRETAQLLLDYGANTFVQGATAIMTAIREKNRTNDSDEVVQLLLDHVKSSGVDGPDASFDIYAKQKYRISCELMSLLLEYGVLGKHHALRFAINENSLQLVKLVLDFDAEIDPRVLQHATGTTELGILQLLLDHAADPQEKARALQSAAYKGSFKHVELLIHADSDVNADPLLYLDHAFRSEARTALQAAAQEGHLEVVRLLLEEGAEVERSSISVDEEGTALQFAAISGSIAIAHELIDRGANVNAAPVGWDGRTALEGAAEHGRLDMVQLLLNLEAEVRGSRALQFARKEGHNGVAMLLLQNGFEDDVPVSG